MIVVDPEDDHGEQGVLDVRPNCCHWREHDVGEEGVLDVPAVEFPGGRPLMPKRAFSMSMIDRRGPLGADDDGEEGVLDVCHNCCPVEGNSGDEEGVLDVHAVGCPGGRKLIAERTISAFKSRSAWAPGGGC